MNHTLRRSPLQRLETQISGNISLKDLTLNARIGFKGADTVAWLESLKIKLSAEPNTASQVDECVIAARLSYTEFFLIDTAHQQCQVIESLRAAWSMDIPERTYLLERADSHACFEISGERAAEMFAKICGIDLRPHKFPPLAVTQTSVGKMNAIVVRNDPSNDKSDKPTFLLLADLSGAEYLWNVVLDAMQEFNQVAV